MTHIVPHPTNQNIIVVVGWGRMDLSFRTLWSVDRGANFGQNDCLFAADNIVAWGVEPIMLQTGRIAWWAVQSGHGAAITTDDYGGNWVSRQEFTDGQSGLNCTGIFGDPFGNKLFLGFGGAASQAGKIYWSVDSGLTWIALDNNPPVVVGLLSVVYDRWIDALFALGGNGDTYNVNLVTAMSPVAQAGTWQDVTDTLLPISGKTSFSDGVGHHIAVIPR
jgi:hypothetical protein